jgi:transposase
LRVDDAARRVIQAPKLEPRIMRYELTDYEWTAIKPFLPNKPRGVPRVNTRRVLNGIFWVLRSGAPWRDLPETFGPYTTCYNRFVRWGRAGVWDQIMDALAAMHDAAVQMIDTSIVRVHQHGACIAGNNQQHMGRSRGGLTTKIHAVVDTNGLPVQIGLTPGETHDNQLCSVLLSELRPQTMLLADRGYDADWIRAFASDRGAWANIPPKRNRKEAICFSPYLYRARNLVERFFNKIKQCRRIATRYDKLAANYLAFIKLASIRIWLRAYEGAAMLYVIARYRRTGRSKLLPLNVTSCGISSATLSTNASDRLTDFRVGLADDAVGGCEPAYVGHGLQVPNDDASVHGTKL